MYIPEGYYFQVSDRILKIFWLSTKKKCHFSSTPPCTKNSHPYERGEEHLGRKKISEGFHPSVRKSAPRFVFYFKIRATGEQGGGKEMVLGPVHPFLNPSVWWQMVSRLVTWHFELDLIMRRIIEQPRNRVCRPSNVNLWHLSDISCKGLPTQISISRSRHTDRSTRVKKIKKKKDKKNQFIDIR